ncbi:MAG: DinB family protein [Bacteroidia bacterium]
MNKNLESIKKYREFILKQISSLTPEQLNEIPTGFNNNIIWNLGHIVSATQAICYKRAALAVTVDDKYFTPFLTNTKPDKFISSEEIEVIKELLITTIDALQNDFENKIFGNYTKSENVERVYGIALNNIDDAIDFLLYHDGVHSGYIFGLKHLV